MESLRTKLFINHKYKTVFLVGYFAISFSLVFTVLLAIMYWFRDVPTNQLLLSTTRNLQVFISVSVTAIGVSMAYVLINNSKSILKVLKPYLFGVIATIILFVVLNAAAYLSSGHFLRGIYSKNFLFFICLFGSVFTIMYFGAERNNKKSSNQALKHDG